MGAMDGRFPTTSSTKVVLLLPLCSPSTQLTKTPPLFRLFRPAYHPIPKPRWTLRHIFAIPSRRAQGREPVLRWRRALLPTAGPGLAPPAGHRTGQHHRRAGTALRRRLLLLVQMGEAAQAQERGGSRELSPVGERSVVHKEGWAGEHCGWHDTRWSLALVAG